MIPIIVFFNMFVAELTARAVYIGAELASDRRRNMQPFQKSGELLRSRPRHSAQMPFLHAVERYKVHVTVYAVQQTRKLARVLVG